MTGNVRSWITYIQLRSANGTQKEHMEIALAAKEIFKSQFPSIAEALGWIKEE
jgi:thymidylate synthase (FAD)